MSVTLQARNATAEDLVKILQDQRARKLDLVTPARNVWSRNGQLIVKGAEAVITEDGVSQANGTYQPTSVFDDGLSSKLEIPRAYLRRMRESRPDILDSTVNGWLHGRSVRAADGSQSEVYPSDQRSFLLRLFRGDDGGTGVARAMLSDKFALSYDNLDVLVAVMSGIRDSGTNVITRVTDLSETRMRVRFEAPELNTAAAGLLDGYRSPFEGDRVKRAGLFDALRQQYGAHHMFSEKDAPVVYTGADLSNSETGGGAYTLTPVVMIVRCTNGLVLNNKEYGIRRVHLGARLGEGEIRPSLDTLRKAGELVAAETRDAIAAWFRPEYLRETVRRLEAQAGVPVEAPTETVPAVVASLGFTPDEARGVLDLFVMSGQCTAGGIAQAVSAYAQTIEDPDRAYDIELQAIAAMELVARR